MLKADDARGLFAALNGTNSLDAALLMKGTGTVLAAWTRNGASLDALSVMSATMVASIASIVETLGSPTPTSAAIETDERRIFAIRVDSQALLVLIGPKASAEGYLRHTARQILSRLTPAPANGRASHDGIPVAPQRR